MDDAPSSKKQNWFMKLIHDIKNFIFEDEEKEGSPPEDRYPLF
ncbi:MAG: hypothetical protein AABZ60_07625 [Planctomycetota bacterium]